jgi:hypothetical protein
VGSESETCVGSRVHLVGVSISFEKNFYRLSFTPPSLVRRFGPSYLLHGTPLGFEYLKQGKYISGDERGGFHVDKVNLPLPDPRLRLFIEGKEDWLEGLLVPARKNKRGRIIEEGSSSAKEGGAQQNYVPPFGGIPTPPSYYRGPTMQAWGSGPTMPHNNRWSQCNLCRALYTIPPNHNKAWP